MEDRQELELIEEESEEVNLGFIRLIGEENDGYYRYEFIFTDNIDEFWGEEFNQKPACLVNNLVPSDEYITEIHIVKMKIKLELLQDNCCFAYSDGMDGIISIAWSQNLDDNFMRFNFGETLENVQKKLAENSILFG
jgi:hypothetical protein